LDTGQGEVHQAQSVEPVAMNPWAWIYDGPPRDDAGREEGDVLDIVKEVRVQRRLVDAGKLPKPNRGGRQTPGHRNPGEPRQCPSGPRPRHQPAPSSPPRTLRDPPQNHRQRVAEEDQRRSHCHQQQVLEDASWQPVGVR